MHKIVWMWLALRDLILAVQPLLAVPIFSSILFGNPPLWLSCLIAVAPLVLRFQRDGYFIRRTPFDIPILLFVLGLLLGLLVSPNFPVSLGAFYTFLACILIYYGLVSNTYAKNSYWLSVAGILCLIGLGLSIWFFSEGAGRLLSFNAWAFKLAEPLPKLSFPVLNLHGVAIVLAPIIPTLFAIALFKNHPWVRSIGLVLTLVFLTIMTLLASGSGWISVTLGLILVIVCWRFWMGGLVLSTVNFIIWQAVANYDKIYWLPRVFSWDSFSIRTELWTDVINLIVDTPFTGLGLGAWHGVYNSFLQLISDAGILGLIALIWAAPVGLRLCWCILTSSRQSHWYGVGVGIIGGLIASVAFGAVETIIAGVIVKSPTSYHYIGIPLLWIWAALFIVAYNHLNPTWASQNQQVRNGLVFVSPPRMQSSHSSPFTSFPGIFSERIFSQSYWTFQPPSWHFYA